MITPDDMKEFERQFGDVKITELDSAMGAVRDPFNTAINTRND